MLRELFSAFAPPALGRIEALDTLDSRQFAIAVKKLANGLTYGIDKSPFVAQGTEFVQSRPYQDGDSVRSIDWRVTARTRRFHVKEFEAPKSTPCFLLVDTSASMAVRSTARSKYELALYVAGGLALACLDRVSPVGVLGVGERPLRVPPTLSKPRILEWLMQLRTYRFDERTQLGVRLRQTAPSLAQRSLIVVLSDLHDDTALPALKRISQLHDCVVLQLVDPAEVSLAGSGFLRAREAETGREIVTHGRAKHVDPERATAELRRAGIDHLVLRTDEPCAAKLRHLFKTRGIARGAR